MEKKMDFMLKLEQTMEKTFQIAYFSKVQSYSYHPRPELIRQLFIWSSHHLPCYALELVGFASLESEKNGTDGIWCK